MPEILNALKIKVNAEKLNVRNAAVRAASLLPKQLRAAKARLAALQAADKEWVAAGAGKKTASETIATLREAGAMDDDGLKKLEASILTTPGLSSAIRQVRRGAGRVARCLRACGFLSPPRAPCAPLPIPCAQAERIVASLTKKIASADKSLIVSEEEAEALGVFSAQETEIILEVAQHLGDNQVRTICMGPTDGFARGTPVVDTGAPITVPVGPGTLGRIMNVVGAPIDERGPIDTKHFLPIHNAPPALANMGDADDILITGIKVRGGAAVRARARAREEPRSPATAVAPLLPSPHRSLTCWRPTRAAARSACLAAPAWARRW